MAYPDAESLGGKLIAAMNESASYFGNPGVTPTEQQLALAKDYAHGGPITNQYLTVAAQRAGYTDATPYATVNSWLAAREAELIKLFF